MADPAHAAGLLRGLSVLISLALATPKRDSERVCSGCQLNAATVEGMCHVQDVRTCVAVAWLAKLSALRYLTKIMLNRALSFFPRSMHCTFVS